MRPRSAFARYALWQVPGWVVVGAIAGIVVAGTGWPWWIVPAAIAVLAARDVALYPAMRATFRAPGTPQPIGRRGVAVDALRPEGLVRVDGELWRARAVGNDIGEHDAVLVTGARGLTLLVEPVDRA